MKVPSMFLVCCHLILLLRFLTACLEHYFEMSRPDAERALDIYKTFGKQTDQVVQYLSLARQYESSTRLEVPKLKHAPTTLTASLEEYLNDPDFEIHRRQYLAQQEAKRTGKPVSEILPPKSSATTSERAVKTEIVNTNKPNPALPKAAPDLLDFFESIEQSQQPMAQPAYPPQQQQQQFQQGFGVQPQYSQFQAVPQQTGFNPFLQSPAAQQPQIPQQQVQPQMPQQQMQPDFTGAGFGGYTPQQQQQTGSFPLTQLQTIPQNGVSNFPTSPPVQSPIQQLQPQQTSTNPFRQSMMPTGGTASPGFSPPARQGTNPFSKQPTGVSSPGLGQNNASPFGPPQPQTQSQELQSSSAFFNTQSSPQQGSTPFASPPPLQPQRTGTNPFAKAQSPPPAAPLTANVTGSTNPFRQSAFVNQQTGQGWQHGVQGTFSGFDMNNVQTTPIFPRPGAN
jgi:phosphatidylinositol-binding clathrin assembly protein